MATLLIFHGRNSSKYILAFKGRDLPWFAGEVNGLENNFANGIGCMNLDKMR